MEKKSENAPFPVFATPAPSREINSVSEFLSFVTSLKSQPSHLASLSAAKPWRGQLWFRGVNEHYSYQAPGVYRDDFQEAAKGYGGGALGKSIGLLERDMLTEFRSMGAPHLPSQDSVEIYFMAQHHGMPTRLLDWTTNPLSALFFACEGGKVKKDGFVYVVDPLSIIKSKLENVPYAEDGSFKKLTLWKNVYSIRHPFVRYAIELSFNGQIAKNHNHFVIPVRPDSVPGRIMQQGSCFTLHMQDAAIPDWVTINCCKIPHASKKSIIGELASLNIDQYTTYFDLDHLSKEIRRTRRL